MPLFNISGEAARGDELLLGIANVSRSGDGIAEVGVKLKSSIELNVVGVITSGVTSSVNIDGNPGAFAKTGVFKPCCIFWDSSVVGLLATLLLPSMTCVVMAIVAAVAVEDSDESMSLIMVRVIVTVWGGEDLAFSICHSLCFGGRSAATCSPCSVALATAG